MGLRELTAHGRNRGQCEDEITDGAATYHQDLSAMRFHTSRGIRAGLVCSQAQHGNKQPEREPNSATYLYPLFRGSCPV